MMALYPAAPAKLVFQHPLISKDAAGKQCDVTACSIPRKEQEGILQQLQCAACQVATALRDLATHECQCFRHLSCCPY